MVTNLSDCASFSIFFFTLSLSNPNEAASALTHCRESLFSSFQPSCHSTSRCLARKHLPSIFCSEFLKQLIIISLNLGNFRGAHFESRANRPAFFCSKQFCILSLSRNNIKMLMKIKTFL